MPIEDVPGISPDELRPDRRTMNVLRDLMDWETRSVKTPWVLGQPVCPFYTPSNLSYEPVGAD